MKEILIVVFIVLIFVLIILNKQFERFGIGNRFLKIDNAEYRGINLLGVNSLDTHIATISDSQCQGLCDKYTECDGYSYYKPGNRCYLFSKGGFVYNRPGFISGMKN